MQYLHSMEIIHSDLKPVRAATRLLIIADGSAQTNIIIDRDFHPRLTSYGLTATALKLTIPRPGSTGPLSTGTVRYMAPELLNPSDFGLKNSNPTKKSDMYAFGVVTYQVSATCFTSSKATKGAFR